MEHFTQGSFYVNNPLDTQKGIQKHLLSTSCVSGTEVGFQDYKMNMAA